MIILKLQAGLGNQMFQYAYGRALALRSSRNFGKEVPLAIDLSWFKNQPERDTKRFYELGHFNIQAKILSEKEVAKQRGVAGSKLFNFFTRVNRKINRSVFGWSDYAYSPSDAQPVKNKYIEGYYWNSEKYFKDHAETIRTDFTLKEPLGEDASAVKVTINQKIEAENILVALQIRRGDYLTNLHANLFHGVQNMAYFEKAVEELCLRLSKTDYNYKKDTDQVGRLNFYIISDDIEWAKQNIIPKDPKGKVFPVEYLSRPGIADYEEMYLMSLCHHFIISNSTYSWWGAWLSTTAQKIGLEKIVIGPKNWVANPKIDTRDVMPENWIRI